MLEEHGQIDALQGRSAPQESNELPKARGVHAEVVDEVRSAAPRFCPDQLSHTGRDFQFQLRSPLSLKGLQTASLPCRCLCPSLTLCHLTCWASGSLAIQGHVVAHELARGVELPSRVLHDPDQVQLVALAQLGSGLLQRAFAQGLPGHNQGELGAVGHDPCLAVLDAWHVANRLLQSLQLDAHTSDLHLPVCSAMVMDAVLLVPGRHIARVVESTKNSHLHKLGPGLLFVVEVASPDPNSTCEEDAATSCRELLKSVGIQHIVPVGGQVVPNSYLVPQLHLAACADYSGLRGPIDVEEPTAWRPDFHDVLAQRLPTTVQELQVWQCRCRDIYTFA
mmetsp:Transcript_38084/g.68914  ORF Transcript_38084/g.68914 Transcript_38084/m.68914 type:complete len:336 (+) Transcript_38084:250-1257(+)